MNMLLNLESPVTTAHRAKLAYIYVRQSTAGQVRQHQESTELPYRLVDRAALFGWPKERIEVIDDDLGKSGTSSDNRGGFQRLIAEIGLGVSLLLARSRRPAALTRLIGIAPPTLSTAPDCPRLTRGSPVWRARKRSLLRELYHRPT